MTDRSQPDETTRRIRTDRWAGWEPMSVSVRRIGMSRRWCAVVVVLSGLLAACGAEESQVESVSSSTPISAIVTVPATSPTATRQLCGDLPEPPAWPIDTIEGLALSSDLAGWARSAEDLGEVALPGPGFSSARLVKVELEQVVRGDQSVRSIVAIHDEFGPQLVSVDSSIVFLVEIDDPALAEAMGIDGPLYSLTPGINSVLDVDGDVAISRCGEFYGLVMADAVYVETVIDPVTSESFVASTEAVTNSYPVDDVVRIVSDPALGPKPASPDFASRCVVPVDRAAHAGECALVDWDLVEVDGASLELSYFGNALGCSEFLDRVETDETDTGVTVRVVVALSSNEGASCPTAPGSRVTTVELAAALGDRVLLGCRPDGSFAPAGGYSTPEPRSADLDCSPEL
jgi:hypothetical protein